MEGCQKSLYWSEQPTDLRQALTNADYVVITIQVSGLDDYALDIEIPKKYGIEQCVGDTLGPGEIFRGLRHMVVISEICRELQDSLELLLRKLPIGWPGLTIWPGSSALNGKVEMLTTCYLKNSMIPNYTDKNRCDKINGNVANHGIIPNLPQKACVEVPCLVDASGIHPCYVGELPEQLAALNRTNISVQELAVQGHLQKDPSFIYQAVKLDPLTAASCSLPQIDGMVKEMFAAQRQWLPQFQ